MTDPKRLFDCLDYNLERSALARYACCQGKWKMANLQHPRGKGNR